MVLNVVSVTERIVFIRFSFFPLSFLYADSARQEMARSQKEQNTRKKPNDLPYLSFKRGRGESTDN